MRNIVSLAFALLLVASACFAGYEVFEFAFAIGDGDGTIGLGTAIFLIGTLVGALGLAIAALGSWTSWRNVSLVALAGGLLVLPAALWFCWHDAGTLWHNTRLGLHYSPLVWATVILPVPFNLAVLLLAGLRLRRFAVKLA